MCKLPDFQKHVADIHKKCVQLFADTQEPHATLLEKFQKRMEECEGQLRNFGPRIMLFGSYNAGKSTLINALLGENKAEVGDVPVTYKEDSYYWGGYCFLDTPGINAPIEHEELTLSKVACNDVVIFVISSLGSFEDRTIYEHMNNILRNDRKLILVINNKSDVNLASENLIDIKRKVFKNLQSMSGYDERVEKVSIHVVNAEEALEGRLNNEQSMVEMSGILSLEDAVLTELRRVHSFEILNRLLDNLENSLQSALTTLNSTVNVDDKRKTVSCQLHEELRNGIEQIRALVERNCAGMGSALFACLPKPSAGAQNIDNEVISRRFAEEVENRYSTVTKEFQVFMPAISQRFAGIVHEGMAHNGDVACIAEHVDVEIPLIPAEVTANNPVASTDEPDSMLGTKISAVAMLLPAVLPWTTPLIILGPLVDLFRGIFGKSKEEQYREQLQAEVAARNRAEEQNALNIAIWRQDARETCAVYANTVTRKLQNWAQEHLEERSRAYLEAAKRMEEDNRKLEQQTLQASAACFEIVRELRLVREELK